MVPDAAKVRLTPEVRSVLEARVRAPTTDQRDVLRARIVLLAGEDRSTRSIAKLVDVMPRTVSLWRGRYAREGLAGLSDNGRAHLPNTTLRRGGAFWRCWTRRRRPASPDGQGR